MMCPEKIAYRSPAKARRALIELRSRLGQSCTSSAVYRCPICYLWHLTSQEQRYLKP